MRILDPGTLWLPDWRGNNRIDSLRNIVRDGRVSLMAMVPGSANVLRVNGTARLTADPAVTGSFTRDGATPRSVIVIAVAEVYGQCARAILRAGLWTAGDQSAGLPSAGELNRQRHGRFRRAPMMPPGLPARQKACGNPLSLPQISRVRAAPGCRGRPLR